MKCNFNLKVSLCVKRFWGTVHRCILPVLVIVLLTAKLAKLETKIFQRKFFFLLLKVGSVVKESSGQIMFLFTSLKLPVAESISDQ